MKVAFLGYLIGKELLYYCVIIIMFIFISFNFTKKKKYIFDIIIQINEIYFSFSVRLLHKLYDIDVVFAEWKVGFVFGRIDTKTQ